MVEEVSSLTQSKSLEMSGAFAKVAAASWRAFLLCNSTSLHGLLACRHAFLMVLSCVYVMATSLLLDWPDVRWHPVLRMSMDWKDKLISSNLQGLQLKELPKEMPVEWSTLLSSLDHTLRLRGVDTMDVGDAVFAMNAVMSAAAESGHRAGLQKPRGLGGSGNMYGSFSAPLTSLGTPMKLQQTHSPSSNLPAGFSAKSSYTVQYPPTPKVTPQNLQAGTAVALDSSPGPLRTGSLPTSLSADLHAAGPATSSKPPPPTPGEFLGFSATPSGSSTVSRSGPLPLPAKVPAGKGPGSIPPLCNVYVRPSPKSSGS